MSKLGIICLCMVTCAEHTSAKLQNHFKCFLNFDNNTGFCCAFVLKLFFIDRFFLWVYSLSKVLLLTVFIFI